MANAPTIRTLRRSLPARGRIGWLAGLAIVALAAAALTAARGADPKPKDDPSAPIMVQVNVTTKAHRTTRCTHTKTEKCVGCQDDGTITLVATGAVKQSQRDPLFCELISMKAHIRYERHWTCPIDGERDIETADKDVRVVTFQTAATQPGGLSVTDGVLTLVQIPMEGGDRKLMGLPELPTGAGALAEIQTLNWCLLLHVPYKTVRRSWPGRENDQWLDVKLHSAIVRNGPSLGQQGFTFEAIPEAKVALLAWNVQNARGGRSINFNDGPFPGTDADAKWSADVGWRIGPATRQVIITYPEAGQNYVFGTPSFGNLEIRPDATTGVKANDFSIEPWSIDPIAGSELKIVTDPGGAQPAKGPEVKITFDKMPTRNDAFGRKTIKAEDGSVTIKVFFDKTAKDNPDGSVPNWFYYWKQGAVPRLEEFHYVEGRDLFGEFTPPDTLEIYDLAGGPEKAYQIQLYQTTRGAHVARPKAPGYYQGLGMIKPWQVLHFPHKTSIEACHGTVLHELRHMEIYQWLASGSVDTDGDGVPDWAEEALEWGLDPLNPDTHFLKDQLEARYAGYGDNELLARIRELDFAPNKDQDWASPGSQTDPPEK